MNLFPTKDLQSKNLANASFLAAEYLNFLVFPIKLIIFAKH